jgi:protein-S-isoprenylcysteine O-methyltransferase Ste14
VSLKHPFRTKNLSPRLLPVYLAAAAVFFFAKPTALGFAFGGLLAAMGLGLRVWGAGHLVKNDRLTVSGPYAYLRHPLYAGTLLLAVGFAGIAGGGGALVVALVVAPAFFLYYLPYKDRVESARLERYYGSAFTAYREQVPKLWPARGAYRPPPELAQERGRRWSMACFRDNSEAGTVLGVALAAALFALRPVLGP